MDFKLVRKWKGLNTTLSILVIYGKQQQHVLEDVDRGLTSKMTIGEIKAVKVPGRTAIPTGRYEVRITYSNRFKRLMPILLDVPGFDGIRIHPGNYHVNTDGCLLPGLKYGKENGDYMVGNSKIAANWLESQIAEALKKGEKVWCTIEQDYTNA
jgi:hypothetical protein